MEDKHAEPLFGEEYALCVRYCGGKKQQKEASTDYASVCLGVFVRTGDVFVDS